MLAKSSLEFLEKFMKSSGPSGFEFEPAALFREYARTFADSVRTDVNGSTIACINPDAKFKVMLAGHYDEFGFQVVYVDDCGLVTFRSVGGIDKHTLPGLEVDILNEKGKDYEQAVEFIEYELFGYWLNDGPMLLHRI